MSIGLKSTEVELLVKECLTTYEKKLPKKGKPQEKEWTTLAAIVMDLGSHTNSKSNEIQRNLKVVAIGTGSKCLSESRLGKDGTFIDDSHAEIIARRGFIR
jgi:tRNA-specific adenosine deaminase 1